MIEPEQVWFHRESLAVVTIGRGGAHHAPPYESNEWVHVVFDGAAALMDPNYFVANYARDEPVTPELLERYGGPEWQAGHNETIQWKGVGLQFVAHFNHEEDYPYCIPGPLEGDWKLRDVLNVLRVFGVRSISPAATENATA